MKKKIQINNNELNLSKDKKNKSCLFNKSSITYLIIFILDIFLVIYSARFNIVNYVTLLDKDIFVSKTRYLLFGRNYINLIITTFFYVYICLMNKFFLRRSNTKKFLIRLFILLVFFNFLLFFLFTKRIY